VLIFKPPFGAYPQELAEIYPLNAEVVRNPDYESLEQAYLNTIKLVELNPEAEFTLIMQERFGHPLVKKLEGMDNVKVIHPQGE
ncbi:MAG: 7-cyano-7-deazaguanine tRNA-ribosyltransferase, partial [Methanolobus sp.]|nr:7-cyano-7-deazaguanine tRNA-ribosyltransferase [Methanolobus sp.]